jgi:hypothetical protein
MPIFVKPKQTQQKKTQKPSASDTSSDTAPHGARLLTRAASCGHCGPVALVLRRRVRALPEMKKMTVSGGVSKKQGKQEAKKKTRFTCQIPHGF